MAGGDTSNIAGVHAEVSEIAALPNEDYTASRVIYSPGAEFQKDGDTTLSPIGWLSDPGNGVVFTGASPAIILSIGLYNSILQRDNSKKKLLNS